MTPQRVFITGALGFIGRRLAERYRDDGAEVAGVDLRADHALGVVAGDVSRPGDWQQAAAGAGLVIHTAALVSLRPSPGDFQGVNVGGTRNALDAAARGGARRFVHFSSITVFGLDYPDGVDERWPVQPTGVPYVDTKVASEQVVLQAHAAGELECTIVRPADVYGPGSPAWTVLPVKNIKAGLMRVPRGGRMTPVYVDNLVDGVMLAASSPEAAGQVFTLSDGTTVDLTDFMGRYARMLGKDGVQEAPIAAVAGFAGVVGLAARAIRKETEMHPGAVRYLARRNGYSIEKARSLLGYEPAVDLDEGMARCERWLRAEGLLS